MSSDSHPGAPREIFWLFLAMVVAAASVICWFAEMALPRPLFITLFALSMIGFISSLKGIAQSTMPEEMDPASDLNQPLSRDPLLPASDEQQKEGGREWTA